MSLQNALEFSSAVLANPALKAEVTSLVAGKSAQDGADALASFGKSKGYDFTAGEILAAQQSLIENNALSEEDLAQIAGGGVESEHAGQMVDAATRGTVGYGAGGPLGAGLGQTTTDLLDGKPVGEAVGNGAVAAGNSYNETKAAASSSW